MRDLKFRVKYTNGKDWIIKIFTLSELMNGDAFDYISDSPLLKKYKMHGDIDEGIGLTDKNGKEIFEGDILIRRSIDYIGEDEREVQRERIYKVVYKQDNCIFAGETYGVFNGKPWSYTYSLAVITQKGQSEIIGNIFENPELINNN